jgi:hypothetical protein
MQLWSSQYLACLLPVPKIGDQLRSRNTYTAMILVSIYMKLRDDFRSMLWRETEGASSVFGEEERLHPWLRPVMLCEFHLSEYIGPSGAFD